MSNRLMPRLIMRLKTCCSSSSMPVSYPVNSTVCQLHVHAVAEDGTHEHDVPSSCKQSSHPTGTGCPMPMCRSPSG